MNGVSTRWRSLSVVIAGLVCLGLAWSLLLATGAMFPEGEPGCWRSDARPQLVDFEGGGHSDIRSSPWPGALSPPEEAKADRPLTTQFLFARPELMQIHWQLGDGGFDSDPIIAPARRNFPEGAVCRLKLSNIPGREGVEFYPTLEVGVSTPQTFAYVARNAVKVDFSAEDFDHMLSGKFATKVIYLPDPEFSEPALADVETLVSTRLDPGVDPVLEADRRGAVLAIIRWGDNDITRSKVCTADWNGDRQFDLLIVGAATQ